MTGLVNGTSSVSAGKTGQKSLGIFANVRPEQPSMTALESEGTSTQMIKFFELWMRSWWHLRTIVHRSRLCSITLPSTLPRTRAELRTSLICKDVRFGGNRAPLDVGLSRKSTVHPSKSVKVSSESPANVAAVMYSFLLVCAREIGGGVPVTAVACSCATSSESGAFF